MVPQSLAFSRPRRTKSTAARTREETRIMADVTLYGIPISTYVRSVRMALAEKGVSYDLVEGWADHPEIAKRQPFGKIPAFRHGDFELYEAFAIARYVDEAFR